MERLPRNPPEVTLSQEPAHGAPLTEAEVAFFYVGFLTILRRYRSLVLIGWTVVAGGFCSLMLGWWSSLPLAFAMSSILTMAAGVALVHLAVATLETYVRVPARDLQGKRGEPPVAPLDEILGLMDSVSAGGWQEAFAAISRLQAIGTSLGFPDPFRR